MKRILGALVAVAAALGAGVVAVGGNEPAGAVGTTHKFASPARSTGTAMEKAARFQVTCNDATGVLSVSLTNVQVIAADAVTPWGRGPDNVHYYVQLIQPNAAGFERMSQNSTNGLYGLKFKTTLPNPSASCYTGATWRVISVPTGPGWLDMSGTLT